MSDITEHLISEDTVKRADMERTETEQGTRIMSAEKTFEIIETLLGLEGATLTELVDRLDMPKSTVFDYLQTLRWLGYVVKRGTTYHVSIRFLDIGLQIRDQMELFQVAKSELEKLANETGEYASLMIEENDRGVIVDTVGSEEATDIGIRPGTRVPLHMSAGGKTMLAHLSEDQVHRIIADYGLARATENTIVDPDELRAELQTVRENGYAINQEERRKGTYAVAAPVQREGSVLAAITVYGPARHVRELAEESLPKRVLRSANIIEVTLNYS